MFPVARLLWCDAIGQSTLFIQPTANGQLATGDYYTFAQRSTSHEVSL